MSDRLTSLPWQVARKVVDGVSLLYIIDNKGEIICDDDIVASRDNIKFIVSSVNLVYSKYLCEVNKELAGTGYQVSLTPKYKIRVQNEDGHVLWYSTSLKSAIRRIRSEISCDWTTPILQRIDPNSPSNIS